MGTTRSHGVGGVAYYPTGQNFHRGIPRLEFHLLGSLFNEILKVSR